ncbi:MAG: hypothetical protein WA435_04715 [Gallionellaceae bacterium]
MSRLFRKPTPFNRQSRRHQRTAYIELKNNIHRASAILGGVFHTHDYLHGQNGWADVYFLGRKAPVFYNAALQTTRTAYKEAVWDTAWDRSYALAPDVEPNVLERMEKDPETGNYVVPEREPVRYPALSGLSRMDWVQTQLPVIADEGTIHVFEEWRLHRDYSYGIGLHVTLDVPFLTIDAINGFIERFLSSELGYRAPQPCNYIPTDVEHWGLESNALVEPWEWPVGEPTV